MRSWFKPLGWNDRPTSWEALSLVLFIALFMWSSVVGRRRTARPFSRS